MKYSSIQGIINEIDLKYASNSTIRRSSANTIGSTALAQQNRLNISFNHCSFTIISNSREFIASLKTYFAHSIIISDGKYEEEDEDDQDERFYMRFINIDEYNRDTLFEVLPSLQELEFKENRSTEGFLKERYFDFYDGRLMEKVGSGIFFLFGTAPNSHLAIGPCRNNIAQCVNFINNRCIQHLISEKGPKRCALFHAAGIALNGRGLGIAGIGGAGKSTLSLHCLSRGASFVSNDRLMIRRSFESEGDGLHIYGVPKMPRVNPYTILDNPNLKKSGLINKQKKEEYKRMPWEQLIQKEEKYDVDIFTSFSKDQISLETNMHGLLILNWDRKSKQPTRIQKVDLRDREDLFSIFVKIPGLVFFQSPKTDSVAAIVNNVDSPQTASSDNMNESTGNISEEEEECDIHSMSSYDDSDTSDEFQTLYPDSNGNGNGSGSRVGYIAATRKHYLDLLAEIPVYEVTGGANFPYLTKMCMDYFYYGDFDLNRI